MFEQSYKPDQKKFEIKFEETMLEKDKHGRTEQLNPKPEEELNIKDISMIKLLSNLEPQQYVAKDEQIYQDKNAFKVRDNISIISHKSLGKKNLVTTYEPEEYEIQVFVGERVQTIVQESVLAPDVLDPQYNSEHTDSLIMIPVVSLSIVMILII